MKGAVRPKPKKKIRRSTAMNVIGTVIKPDLIKKIIHRDNPTINMPTISDQNNLR